MKWTVSDDTHGECVNGRACKKNESENQLECVNHNTMKVQVG